MWGKWAASDRARIMMEGWWSYRSVDRPLAAQTRAPGFESWSLPAFCFLVLFVHRLHKWHCDYSFQRLELFEHLQYGCSVSSPDGASVDSKLSCSTWLTRFKGHWYTEPFSLNVYIPCYNKVMTDWVKCPNVLNSGSSQTYYIWICICWDIM